MARRIGLSNASRPPPLLKMFKSKPTLKVSPGVDDPPLSTDEEGGDGAGEVEGTDSLQSPITQKRSNQKGNSSSSYRRSSKRIQPPPNDDLLDSSDDAGHDRRRRASIKGTKFEPLDEAQRSASSGRGGKKTMSYGSKPNRPAPEASVKAGRASNRNTRAQHSDEDVLASNSSQALSTNPKSSASSFYDDANGFTKRKAVKETYASKRTAARRTKLQAPPPELESPQKPRTSLIMPSQDSLSSPTSDIDGEFPVSSAASKDKGSGPIKEGRGARKRKRGGRLVRHSVSPPPKRAVLELIADLPEKPTFKPVAPSRKLFVDLSDLSDLDSDLDMPKPMPANRREDGDTERSKSGPSCPWCGNEVGKDLLEAATKGGRMTVRMQMKFCKKHRTETARTTWNLRRYPRIDWDTMTERCRERDGTMLRIINGQASHFRTILAEDVKTGRNRVLKHGDDFNPGYYGPRGFNLMCDYLGDRFGHELKQRAVEDRVISGRGIPAFVQLVLLPELAVQLIQQDMEVSEEKARHILEDSKELGALIHDED